MYPRPLVVRLSDAGLTFGLFGLSLTTSPRCCHPWHFDTNIPNVYHCFMITKTSLPYTRIVGLLLIAIDTNIRQRIRVKPNPTSALFNVVLPEAWTA